MCFVLLTSNAIFYSDTEILLKYSPVKIQLSPATRILENPAMVSVLNKELECKVEKLKYKKLEVMKDEKQI